MAAVSISGRKTQFLSHEDYIYAKSDISGILYIWRIYDIQLLEFSKTSPSPPSSSPPPSSPSRSGYPPSISGTKCGTVDPLVSKRPEKILNRKIQKKKEKKT